MSTQITLEYFGFQGQGATVKAAKQDAGQKIAALHEGIWQPTLREWRGEAVLVYRTLNGWVYSFLQHASGPLQFSGTCMGNGEFWETLRSAERHLADTGWKTNEPITDFPEWFHNEQDRKEIMDGRKWQLRIQELVAKGYSMDRARNIAFGMEEEDEA
jgi:hypothetical protein